MIAGNVSATPSSGLRAVALFEAAKGMLALLAGCGLLALLHENLQAAAEQLVERLHLNPASRYPAIFVQAMETLNDGRLWLLAGGAAAYAALRFVEAYGLWRERRWAEWLAVLSGAIYVPFEIYELDRGVTVLKGTALLINVVIVIFLSRVLWRAN